MDRYFLQQAVGAERTDPEKLTDFLEEMGCDAIETRKMTGVLTRFDGKPYHVVGINICNSKLPDLLIIAIENGYQLRNSDGKLLYSP